MRGQTVVLDSSNLSAVIADAVGEAAPADATVPAVEKAEAEAKTEPAKEPVEAKAEPEEVDDNGLTVEEKRDLTEKMQRAIGKKHRAMREAEEFAEDQYKERRMAEQRAEQLEREINRMKAQLAPEPVKTETERPKRESFKTDEEYQDAMVDFRVDLKDKERQAEAAKQRDQERMAQIVKDAQSRISKAKELVEDFEETVGKAEIEVPPHIAGYMQESEMLAELGYHFAKNPDALEKLRGMSPSKALVAIGKIEAILKPFAPAAVVEQEAKGKENGKTETVKEPSQEKPRASAPITPLNGGSANQVQKDPRDRTYAEERADYQRRNKVNLTKRQRH